MDRSELWYEEKENVERVVTNIGTTLSPKWEINMDELALITNNHPQFIHKVSEFINDYGTLSIKNAAVYRFNLENIQGAEKYERIAIVFDVYGNFINLFSCCTDHQDGNSFVTIASYPKPFISQMATML
ncbi:hypothetical protein [Paenibacillus tyrfis]|uniref:hypothetical protein n=1 Tax=Paenibacillus tyrfis TaxID=1501230 RepID=UPI00209E40FF|nr:hypothetical protein [Paenibacillus tyrfis]MCP1312072.1 hypothetical protein [Paenibacillus tyrfis]